jgi:hypothetical protein
VDVWTLYLFYKYKDIKKEISPDVHNPLIFELYLNIKESFQSLIWRASTRGLTNDNERIYHITKMRKY